MLDSLKKGLGYLLGKKQEIVTDESKLKDEKKRISDLEATIKQSKADLEKLEPELKDAIDAEINRRREVLKEAAKANKSNDYRTAVQLLKHGKVLRGKRLRFSKNAVESVDENGGTVWKFEGRYDDLGTFCAQFDDRIYVDMINQGNVKGEFDSYLTALDPATGMQLWQFRCLKQNQPRHVIQANDKVVMQNLYQLVCLDAKDGCVVWKKRYDIQGGCFSSIDENKGVVYVDEYDKIVARKLDDGSEVWKWDHEVGNAEVKYHNGKLFVAESQVLTALDAKKGKKLWSVERGHDSQAVDADGNNVYTHGNGKAFAFDTKKGKKIWEHDLKRRGQRKLVVDSGNVYFGVHGRYHNYVKLVCLDAETGKHKWDSKQFNAYKAEEPEWGNVHYTRPSADCDQVDFEQLTVEDGVVSVTVLHSCMPHRQSKAEHYRLDAATGRIWVNEK